MDAEVFKRKMMKRVDRILEDEVYDEELSIEELWSLVRDDLDEWVGNEAESEDEEEVEDDEPEIGF